MSLHSYSQCWLHLIWATHKREPMITKPTATKVSEYLFHYANSKGIYMKINFVNVDHVHCLIGLPTNLTIEGAANLLKGASSHWIGEQKISYGRFQWARGYGAFSVSQSDVSPVSKYIANQEEHHRRRSFMEEYRLFLERHGLKCYGEDT